MKFELEILHEKIIDSALVAIGVTDLNGSFILVNRTWCDLLGYSEQEAKLLTFREITPKDDLDISDDNYHKLITRELVSFQKIRQYQRKDGTTFWANLYVSAIVNEQDQVEGVLGIFIDIDRQVKAEGKLQQSYQTLEQLYKTISLANTQISQKNKELTEAYIKLDELARTDELTKLPNRRELERLLSQEQNRTIRTKRAFTVVIGDIDSFKKVNDTHGHDAGDVVLIELAKTLHEQIRNTDYMGRWGGEEFLFILPETTCTGAQIVMDRIRQTISHLQCQHNDMKLNLTMTFGFSTYKAGSDINAVLKEADMALYYGKLHGKNMAVCYETIERLL